jgi:methylphosphotriester-DNA--protein-cysteine methyltransferase
MKAYQLLDSHGRVVFSAQRGTVGGHQRSRIFGRLDCPAALRALSRGGYRQHRVFFADAATAAAAGYRPCAVCMPDAYRAWKRSPSRR